VHPWETGLDNSPAWDSPLHAVPADLGLFDTYTRRDLAHAGAGERPTDEDYARYIRLALAYRDHGYDDDWVRAEGEFLVVDPAFNALWAWSELALAELAGYAGADSEPHRMEADRILEAMVVELWSEELGIFIARDARTEQRLGERTVAGLLPLLLPALPRSLLATLVSTLTGDVFRAGDQGIYGVPSFDLTEPRHDPQRYWRGPAWQNTTWLVTQGLRTHGRHELARKLTNDMVRLTHRSGLREYFNPKTGSGHGTDDFSWSAALLIDALVGIPATAGSNEPSHSC
jgi:glycogen debranching enzyme